MSESKQPTLADRTLSELQNAIIQGDLAPGSKINEQELAARYGVSRGPLREALQRLEQRRLVERIPHVGATVVRLTPEKLRDLYQVRAELEAMACRLAAQRITPSQVNALTELLDRQQVVFSQPELPPIQDDIDFHFGLIQASGNSTLITTLTGDLYYQLQMYRNQCSSGRRPLEALAQHRRILDAVAQGDGELAALLMRRHIEAGARHTAQLLRQTMEELTA
ncbi:transcriptional regulator, GntR family [Ferrimonas balearica DSM 9799]|uniref:Transcriptional regulator, GntR family n=1 Tax=Ferrimonas balearica (strain DSM 9799 / CCM 4581 / KCTC 23876 / PAT) TaxID=550540 RepID=E1SPN5_FERBD|nr:GntR family transcriptional regulator [Ferrimonas balearica]MBY6019602.1 GntR family transcriptional regulator [Halomonas denitrificans]ADN77852.1 transcriptional regulator, GntR family [Ferrimonas balearica DSM 9799]MBW3141451.1 GntR family transcriptional regulator [Ferrimonas balearica]MBW3166383.1 GntR family transcriptional regulator [Ferrimonas balearica]MBY5982210.1 GntR family transcriptional regulator [Ferrimonas balearica]